VGPGFGGGRSRGADVPHAEADSSKNRDSAEDRHHLPAAPDPVNHGLPVRRQVAALIRDVGFSG
jgi:hypothetical protein